MKGALLFSGCAFAGVASMVVRIHFRSKSICESNIEHLEWMQEHVIVMNPPATPDEEECIVTELNKQREYRNQTILFPFPPTVNWIDLPMDDAYVKRFYS